MKSLFTVASPAVAMDLRQQSKTVQDQILEYKPQKKLKTETNTNQRTPIFDVSPNTDSPSIDSYSRPATFDDFETASQETTTDSDLSATVRKQEGSTCQLHSILSAVGNLLRKYGELDNEQWSLIHDYLFAKGEDKFYSPGCERGKFLMLSWIIKLLHLGKYLSVQTIWDRGSKSKFMSFVGKDFKPRQYLAGRVVDFDIDEIRKFKPLKKLCNQFGYLLDEDDNLASEFGYHGPKIWGLYTNVKKPDGSGHAMAASPSKTMAALTNLCESMGYSLNGVSWPPSQSKHVYAKNSWGKSTPFPTMDILNVQMLIALQETEYAEDHREKFQHRVFKAAQKLLSKAQDHSLNLKKRNRMIFSL